MSLTNEPDKLLHTSLDTLAEVLGIESGWVQTIEIGGDLTLAAARGLTSEMKRTLGALKRNHPIVREVTGLGHKVVISNLASSDMEGIEPFRSAGIRWLIAVPLMTYRVHGILGAASRYRKRLDKHTPDLIMVTGRLIATALIKANMARTPAVAAEGPKGNGNKITPEALEETRGRVREVKSRLAAAKAASLELHREAGDTGVLIPGGTVDPAPETGEKEDRVPDGTQADSLSGAVPPEETDIESPVVPVTPPEVPFDIEKLLREISLGTGPVTLPLSLQSPLEPGDAGQPEEPPVRPADAAAEPLPGAVAETPPAEETPVLHIEPVPVFTPPEEAVPEVPSDTAETGREPEKSEPATPPVPELEFAGKTEHAAPDVPESATETLAVDIVPDDVLVHDTGSKPRDDQDVKPGQEDKFIRHARRMASFRSRHAPLR